jgi:hypothetical protein
MVTLWKFNIANKKMAIEIVDLPIKILIVHSYVSLPEGIMGEVKTLWFQDWN